ncbi:hypothetical protein BT96DRAFT_983828 [Gymnopus androsaceus JB14]|uniref:Uncharacterized protein n=1 Tax=Gymnopus androsaceus JB14 TaxID=1447944 RepID=A0A6A4IHZ9_9AGAR|nr:hypothetical protein BT96DRAFT_983828 [Gymnopus androsaceus JB14]
MSAASLVLVFVFSSPGMRNFKVHQLSSESSASSIELHKFHHPETGFADEVTTFHRQNLATSIFEAARKILWTNAVGHFGLEEVHIRDLRRVKKPSSRSRRFKAGGSEYKWRIAPNSTDLLVVYLG